MIEQKRITAILEGIDGANCLFPERRVYDLSSLSNRCPLMFNQLKIRVVEVEDSNLTCGLTFAALTY